ncbi:MAG: DUF565 domain-containing protein [Cyanobacteriota bacterium]|nr:MAG: DUF565 domain-containing protein [Cyanobacteriota bacterium]
MTRIVLFINQFFLDLERKSSFFKEIFSFALFTLFIGFLIGNLFGTFLNTIRSFIFWDGLIIFIILSVMEFLNFFLYRKKNRFLTVSQNIYYSETNQTSLWDVRQQKRSFLIMGQGPQSAEHAKVSGLKKKQNQFFWKSLNFLKIGIMFGFFIDAFKVGS